MNTSPYHTQAPWPCMRGNLRNTGAYIAGQHIDTTTAIQHTPTYGAIFSTPVIGPNNTIYVGSADHTFYAISATTGAVRWKKKMNEIIDSAACIGPEGNVYIPAADGLYACDANGNELWKLDLVATHERFTPSTIYWWEGNVVMGPNGWLYAGCDDFHMYAIDPSDGSVKWSVLTGCCIWTAPVFGQDDMVYFASFDRFIYALDQNTGQIRWTKNIENFVVSSPAVGNGELYFGSFDGNVYALDAATGRQLWSIKTNGSLYASPTLSADGMLYIGSSDGNLYCIDTHKKEIVWKYFMGDTIRSSAAIGLDPEGTADYLVYVGGGNGQLYAVDPHGKRRWSYDTTLARKHDIECYSINASIALGQHSIVTATSSGDVVSVPYDAYLRDSTNPAFCKGQHDDLPTDGEFLCLVSLQGLLSSHTQEHVTVAPGETISLRLLHRADGENLPLRFLKHRVRLGRKNSFSMRSFISPDGNQINLVPKKLQKPGDYTLKIRAPYSCNGKVHTLKKELRVTVQEPAVATTDIEPFRITQISVNDPAIVASFDQIALASLAIETRILKHDPRTGRVLAWGVQKFGVDEHGTLSVGIPIPRYFFFAWSGQYSFGSLMLLCKNCLFELSAFPVQLSEFRVSAHMTKLGLQAKSLFGRTKILGAIDRLKKRVETWGIQKVLRFFSLCWLHRKACMRFVVSWFPSHASFRQIPNAIVGVVRQLQLAIGIVRGRIWQHWKLFDLDGHFHGTGTFQVEPTKFEGHTGLQLKEFIYDQSRKALVASFTHEEGYNRTDAVPGILVYNALTLKPERINYSEWIHTERDTQGRPVKTVLELPRRLRIHKKHMRAMLLVDLDVRAELTLSGQKTHSAKTGDVSISTALGIGQFS